MADLCVAECKILFSNPNTMSSLQQIATAMVTSKHSVLYKHFFALVSFFLTLPVTSASCEVCERPRSKVDIELAVRASMISERLEDLILISSEKILFVINLQLLAEHCPYDYLLFAHKQFTICFVNYKYDVSIEAVCIIS